MLCDYLRFKQKKSKQKKTYEEAKNKYIEHHLEVEAKVYNRPQQIINGKDVSGEAILKEINDQNITLAPFTIDDFGSLG